MAQSVFLLQNSKDANKELKEKLINEGVEVVGENTDGEKAVGEIMEIKPDLLVTGLVISGADGISVIERVKEKLSGIKVLVLSALVNEETISRAMDSGADYYMAKPCKQESIVERIKQMLTEEKKEKEEPRSVEVVKKNGVSIDEKISRIFINVGIPPHIKGYAFLREGVKMAISEPEIINSITKKLYPKIGERYSTSASKVERAIRHAIEVAWNRGRIDNINNILGVRAYMGAEKPTNSEFIALVADKMILERA